MTSNATLLKGHECGPKGTPIYEDSEMARVDLEPILAKLCHPVRGLGWDLQRAKLSIEQYRRWLWLNAVYDDVNLSPSKDVDQVWHMHILDTRKYADDCARLFGGRFLHHNPYAGWESEESELEHQANYRRTKRLFTEHFGMEFIGDEGLCMTGYCDPDVTSAARKIWRPGISDAISAAQ